MPESGEPIASGDTLADSLEAVEETGALIQHLTNEVTMNDVANVTLHWGTLPVMADSPEEAPQMAAAAGGILINMGRSTEDDVRAMKAAGERANELGVPVVFDPVGVGSTPTRNQIATELLDRVEFAAINGNYGEIAALAGEEATVKGVESVGDYETIGESARALAEATDAAVVASGVEDVVADADAAYALEAGHEMMGAFVGTGCMLGATVAAFASAIDDSLTAALHGTLAFGIAGERAAEIDYHGPASYRTNFLDAVAGLDAETAATLDIGDRVSRKE